MGVVVTVGGVVACCVFDVPLTSASSSVTSCCRCLLGSFESGSLMPIAYRVHFLGNALVPSHQTCIFFVNAAYMYVQGEVSVEKSSAHVYQLYM